jgi:hypothetical protein
MTGTKMRRATVWLVLLALSVTTLGPVLHGVHDTDLQPPVVHDERHHHYRGAPSAEDGLESEHCVACHFARSFRGPVSWGASSPLRFSTGSRLAHIAGELPTLANPAPRPSRAPPLA